MAAFGGGVVIHSTSASIGASDVHVEVAEIVPSVFVAGLLRMRVFLRLIGAFVFGPFVRSWFCCLGFMTAKHASNGVAEQHAAGHTERRLRSAGEEASTARLLRCIDSRFAEPIRGTDPVDR